MKVGHSKYYYDYTRNMSIEQEKDFYKTTTVLKKLVKKKSAIVVEECQSALMKFANAFLQKIHKTDLMPS